MRHAEVICERFVAREQISFTEVTNAATFFLVNVRSLASAGLFALLAQSTNAAADPVSLQHKWPLGQRLVYRMEMNQTMTGSPQPIKSEMSSELSISVTKELPNGDREVVFEVLSQKMMMSMNGRKIMEFDSKAPAAPNSTPDPMAEMLKKMVGVKITHVIGPDGKVKEVKGVEEMLKTIGGADPQSQEAMKAIFNPEHFKQVLGSDFLPARLVNVGDSWHDRMKIPAAQLGEMNVRTTSTLGEITEREGSKIAVIDVTGQLSFSESMSQQLASERLSLQLADGNFDGKILFDVTLGAIRESVIHQRFTIKSSLPDPRDPQESEITVTIGMVQDMITELIEVGKVK